MHVLDVEVTNVCPVSNGLHGFQVELRDGSTVTARKVLLATGMTDTLPRVPGFMEVYGTSAFHCPYCDGWEVRDMPLAAYASGEEASGFALALLNWSRDVALCTDGGAPLEKRELNRLQIHGVRLFPQKLRQLESTHGKLTRILFQDGTVLDRTALFFHTGRDQRSDLPARLGCDFTSHHAVNTTRFEQSNLPGLYVAGDASRDVQFVSVAAAEGVKAAYAINQDLMREGLREKER